MWGANNRKDAIPFPALHSCHSRLYIVVVAINLLFEVFLPIPQMFQGVVHTGHLLLALEPLSMLAANIACDGIEDALESIASGDLS
jgi:hypothetical protein